MFITIITTLDIVLLPHMSGLFAKDNIEKIVTLMNKTLHLQLFFSIPLMFGMLTVYDKLVPWFFGNKFLYINNIIPYFSLLIVVVPLGAAISRQYLIPIGKVREYNKSVIFGAVINIISNSILLPTIGFFGVVISNILSEVFVTVTRSKSFIEQTNFKFDTKKIFLFFISALVMMISTRFLTKDMSANLYTNIFQVIIAFCIYIFLTSITKVNPLMKMIKWRNKK